jgi:ferric-dicitrate binding protein FerR (iron transport regulator)
MDQYQKLIQLYYEGKATAVQEQELLHAIKTDKQLFDEFKKYEYVYKPEVISEGELSAIYRKVSEKQERNKQNKGTTIWLSVTKYAAILLLGALSLWFIQTLDKKQVSASHYYTLMVPRGEKSQFDLPDGSKVWLNSETVLKVPVNFNEENRQVELIGEALFEVESNQQKAFVVKTRDYDVKVTGTQFNVRAYADDTNSETSLLEGGVEIFTETTMVAELKPGQGWLFNRDEKTFSKTQPNIEAQMAWRNNQFVFDDISFTDLAERLGRWYDVEVVIMDEDLKELRYSGKFKNKETIWQVLDIIQVTTPIKYTLNNRQLKIYKRK